MTKLLVANRGEIALRIMQSAREMGIKTVAVFSEADRNALHVRFADEAVFLGPAPSAQSYLLGEKIIEACRQTGADAIHPGYGFLSENAAFAESVKKAGLIFIGPSPEAMRTMGSKIGAKQAVGKFGVPMVPGIDYAISDVKEAKKVATEIGYPVLIKASAGGGGKGMRVVNKPEELEEQMQRAQSEAQSSFGDSSVFIEKFVTNPRHIEIQILGDSHGNVIHLFERECSIQRRHQKLVEEAPSSILTEEVRKKMGEAAVNVGKACNYTGAGTVEFLVDDSLNFYFLEMNTRLQVEHPVTELITGLDLVKEQIRIARGEKLSFRQSDLKIHGHAIELRVCAEDPSNNFLPDTGTLTTYQLPPGIGIRVDTGFEEGMTVPVFYDSMLAKLIVWAGTRNEAIERMKRAIANYKVTGVKTTLPFGEWVMNTKEFTEGNFNTHFIDAHFKPEMLNAETDEEESLVAALIAAQLLNSPIRPTESKNNSMKQSNWKKNRVSDQ